MRRYELNSSLRSFIIWVSFSFLLLGADRYGMLSLLRGSVEGIVLPLEIGLYKVSRQVREPFKMLAFWRVGARRIADLERQVAELSVDAAKVQQLEKENEELRKLIGANLPASFRYILAPIIGRGESVSIVAGEVNGVSEGDAVISGDVLLGTVADVSVRQSSLMLISDPRTKIAVYAPRTGAKGMLSGRFGSQVILTQVLQEEELGENELLITSGDFGAPRGLVVGRVERTISDETDVYKEVAVKPALDIGDLSTVFVIKED